MVPAAGLSGGLVVGNVCLYFVPNRQTTISDVVIDAVGIGLAARLIWLWQHGYFSQILRFIPTSEQAPNSLGRLHSELVHLMR